MEYIDRDFDKLLLNVYKYKIGNDLFKIFPILTKYEEFNVTIPQLDIEKCIRYIVYAFDPNSPVTAINDILERRVEAARLAGFTPKPNGKFSVTVEKMLRSITPKVNHMVIRYCMFTGDTDYSVMVTFEDSLVKELQTLANFGTKEAKGKPAEDQTDEKKSIVIANIEKLRKNINELRTLFLANNVDYFLSRSLSEFSEAKKIELSPEYYAEKLKGWNNISRYWGELNISNDEAQ